MGKRRLRGASRSGDLSLAHLQLQLAKVGLATERYRVLGEALKLAQAIVALLRAVVALLMVGAALWGADALGADLTLIIEGILAEVLA
jgi:hypothetical protein